MSQPRRISENPRQPLLILRHARVVHRRRPQGAADSPRAGRSGPRARSAGRHYKQPDCQRHTNRWATRAASAGGHGGSPHCHAPAFFPCGGPPCPPIASREIAQVRNAQSFAISRFITLTRRAAPRDPHRLPWLCSAPVLGSAAVAVPRPSFEVACLLRECDQHQKPGVAPTTRTDCHGFDLRRRCVAHCSRLRIGLPIFRLCCGRRLDPHFRLGNRPSPQRFALAAVHRAPNAKQEQQPLQQTADTVKCKSPKSARWVPRRQIQRRAPFADLCVSSAPESSRPSRLRSLPPLAPLGRGPHRMWGVRGKWGRIKAG